MHFSLAITYRKFGFAFLEMVGILGKEHFCEFDEAWV